MPSAVQTLYRRLYWAPSDVRRWRTLRQIDRLVYLGGGGIGDSLNCSALLHEMNRRTPGRVSMMTPHPELFAANPDARSVHAYDPQLVTALERWGHDVVHPFYEFPQTQPPRAPVVSDHLVAQMCRRAGLVGEVALRPHFHFQPGEKEAQRAYAGCVVVQSSVLNARHTLPAKNWSLEKLQHVADALRPRWRLVQLGHRDDTPIAGAEDLRGQLPLRAAAAVLAQARFFVGLVGFLMHLARAVETRSVIVYGGREHALQSGYLANENLVGPMPCSPCGINDDCKVGHGCMTQIMPDHVLAAVARLATRLGTPLEVERVTL